MSKTLLTIAIPTYNREKYLIETIESVIKQIEDDVEILVSDNASTDNTQEIIKEYCKKYPFISYYRNENNMGFDGNFLQCLKKGKGEYIQLLSSDDILLEGSIKAIKKCLKENNNISYLSLNFSSFDGNFKVDKIKSSHYKLEKDIIFENKDLFLELVGIYITFCSTSIYRKKDFLQIENPEQFIGNCLLLSHVAMYCIKAGRNAVVSHVCIAGRRNNSGGYDYFTVFTYEWKKVLFNTGLQIGFAKSSLNKTFKETLKGHTRSWVKNIRLDTTKNNDFGLKRSILFKNTWNYPEAWICVYPYAFLPKGFLMGVKRIEAFFKNKKMRKCVKETR